MKNIKFLTTFFLCALCGVSVLFFLFSCTPEKPGVTGKKPEGVKGDNLKTPQAQPPEAGKSALPKVKQAKKNSLPEFTRIKIMPEVFKSGDTLYVDAAGNDADGDPVEILYEWTKNGEPAGSGPRIDESLKRGDKVSVKITLFDGKEYSRRVVLQREVQNFPPVIMEDNKFNFDGKVFSYQVKASDPDDDTLTYSLKSAEAGMNINPAAGLIQWNVPPEFKGKAAFTVSVTDGHGGEAAYQLTLTLNR